MSFTLKAVGFVSAGTLLMIISLLTLDVQMLAMGVILLALVAVTKLMRVKVRISRKLDTERILEGERITVKVKVRNTSRREAMVILFDQLPPEVRLVEGSNRQALVLEAGMTTRLKYTIECPLRGFYSLGPMKLRRRDFFNLYFEEESEEEITYFSVYPRFPELEKFPIKSYHSSIFETLPLAKVGLGYEFFCIRDYQKGDPFKRINWKIFARRRDLMVNEYETENLHDALIILDAREVTRAGTVLNNSLELSVKMAASVANFLLKGRNQVGLMSYGGEGNAFMVPPAPGKNQLDEILSVLVGVKAGGSEPFKAALDKAKPYLTPRTTLILISPLDDDVTVVEAAKEVMEHYRFIIFTPNSYEIEKEVTGLDSAKHGLFELEKGTLLDELQSFGATTIMLTPDEVAPELPKPVGVF